MRCPYCGTENEEGQVLCKKCGMMMELNPTDTPAGEGGGETKGSVYPIEEKMKEKGMPTGAKESDWREELRRRVEEIRRKREFEKTLGPEWQEFKIKRAKEEVAKIASTPSEEIKEEKKEKEETKKEEILPPLPPLSFEDKQEEKKEEPEAEGKEGELPSFLEATITQEVKPKPSPKDDYRPLDTYQPIGEMEKVGEEVDESFASAPLPEEVTEGERDLIIRGKIVASIIDFIISSSLFAGAFYGVMRLTSLPPLELFTKLPLPLSALYLLINMVYSVFFVSASGQTIGRMIAGIRVVSEDYDRVSFFRAFLRWFGGLISSLPLLLGHLFTLSDPEARGIPDKLASTRVELLIR